MTRLPRRALRKLLVFLGHRPRLKRWVVDAMYRLPWIDSRLRELAYRVVHPEARLDVDATHLPEGGRRSFERMRARTPR